MRMHRPGWSPLPTMTCTHFFRSSWTIHKAYVRVLDAFEEVLNRIQEKGLGRDALQGLRDFFHYLDEQIFRHSVKEEKLLFPLLQERLLEHGEHSKSSLPKTAVATRVRLQEFICDASESNAPFKNCSKG